MAYLQARSGIARSGVTYSGWTPPNVTVRLAGVDRSADVLMRDWALTLRADGQPATFRFKVKNTAPALGQDVRVTYTTPDDYLFGGTLLQVESTPSDNQSTHVLWDCTAVGYQWLLNRYTLVLAQYASAGVSTIVADILSRFTDGGFTVGYVPASLGTLSMEFTWETVWDALRRIAKAKGAVVDVTPTRAINMYVTYPEAPLTTVTEADILVNSLTYRGDLTQVRTRTLYEGAGSTTTTAVSAGAATIPIADLTAFDSGTAVIARSLVTYTGRSALSGPGVLTGVTGLLYDVGQNEAINIVVAATDAAADTALATLLGGGLDGQATNYLQDGRLSSSEATARASADLDTFGGALEDISFVWWPSRRYLRAGRTLPLSVSYPIAISGTYLIQSVTITPCRRMGGEAGLDGMMQTIQLGSFTRSLTELLQQLRG
jgi:hypothetical protein